MLESLRCFGLGFEVESVLSVGVELNHRVVWEIVGSFGLFVREVTLL